ncbi:unnamed protein product, partial [Aphanomyces euteiches]
WSRSGSPEWASYYRIFRSMCALPRKNPSRSRRSIKILSSSSGKKSSTSARGCIFAWSMSRKHCPSHF